MNNDHFVRVLVAFLLLAVVASCGDPAPAESTGRWYTAEQVEQGGVVFQTHCASCHGANAEGTTEWRKTDANGNYPPPPLNGTAHTWHHALSILELTIAEGGVALGGVMPGFAGILDAEETRSVIAYFQNQWTDDIYARWQEIDAD